MVNYWSGMNEVAWSSSLSNTQTKTKGLYLSPDSGRFQKVTNGSSKKIIKIIFFLYSSVKVELCFVLFLTKIKVL